MTNKLVLTQLVAAATLFILAVLVLTHLPSTAADPACASSIRDAQSMTNRCGLGVDAGAHQASLRVRASLTQGGMSWALEDPQGIIRWEGSAAAGRPVDSAWTAPNPLPGRWNLKIRLEDAAGEYTAPWVVQ